MFDCPWYFADFQSHKNHSFIHFPVKKQSLFFHWRLIIFFLDKNTGLRDFPGGPVVRILHFYCRDHCGNWDPTCQPVWQKKYRFKMFLMCWYQKRGSNHKGVYLFAILQCTTIKSCKAKTNCRDFPGGAVVKIPHS